MTYPNTQLFINGQWQDAADGRSLAVFNPATGKEIGRVAHAGKADLDKALEAAQKGFETWRDMTAADRSKIMRKAAGLMRERAAEILRTTWLIGKFHGVKAATGPTGSLIANW